MNLSTDLLSQFAKVTNDKKETKKETTVYGEVVTNADGDLRVRFDGSEMLTPVASTMDVKVGDRVSVQLKNHTATVTGNITSPAARVGTVEEIEGKTKVYIDEVVADKVDVNYLKANFAEIKKLEAVEADIETLRVNKANIKDLEAANAKIKNLEAGQIDTDYLNANYASIENLNTANGKITNLEGTFADFKNLTVDELASEYAFILELDSKEIDTESLTAEYVKIDWSNIEVADIGALFAKSGMVDNMTVKDEHVTGKLVGVTIHGDMIDGNTIKANRLLVQGQDGLYYQLNVNALGEAKVSTLTEDEQEELKNGLHGSVIIAKSITANEIKVSDLEAFDATIGGFTITDNAIHSNAKGTVNATTPGIYLDSDGQVAIGNNSDNYIRYSKQSDGTYKLEIEADSILLKTAEKHVNIGDYESRISTAETTISSKPDRNELTATKTEIEKNLADNYYTKTQTDSAISQTASNIRLSVSETYATKQSLEDLEIGATNLILNSNFANSTDKWVISGVSASVETDETHGSCLMFTSSAVGSSTQRIYPSPTDNFIHTGGTYSLSFYAKTDEGSTATLQTNIAGGTGGVKNYNLTSSWKRYTHTYDASNGSITFWLNESGATAYITKVQMERGDKVTDWNLAPSELSTVKDLNSVKDSVKDIEGDVSTAVSDINILADKLEFLVRSGQNVSLLEQTADGWVFNLGTINNAVNDVSAAIKEVEENADSTEAAVKSLKDIVDDIGELTEKLNVGTYTYYNDEGVMVTEPSIELYELDSNFRLLMTNTQAVFTDGVHELTTINIKGQTVENLTVRGEIGQGKFAWKSRTNGNYGLMWKG